MQSIYHLAYRKFKIKRPATLCLEILEAGKCEFKLFSCMTRFYDSENLSKYFDRLDSHNDKIKIIKIFPSVCTL